MPLISKICMGIKRIVSTRNCDDVAFYANVVFYLFIYYNAASVVFIRKLIELPLNEIYSALNVLVIFLQMKVQFIVFTLFFRVTFKIEVGIYC
jgi:hypothetical protein